jgi:hypothetical protein
MSLPFADAAARKWTLVGLLALVPSTATAGGGGSVLRVPRGAAPVIDGTMGEAEWEGAAVRTGPNGTTVRARHDGRHLFLGIAAAQEGFASICASDGDAVRVFHASAALGLVTYTRAGADWTTPSREFVYGMRATALTEEANAERSAYLAAHGWLASTVKMGEGRTQEVRLALDDGLGRVKHLAISRFVIEPGGGFVSAWPPTMAKEDGCREPELVRGNVPPRLRFEPERWIALEMEP